MSLFFTTKRLTTSIIWKRVAVIIAFFGATFISFQQPALARSQRQATFTT